MRESLVALDLVLDELGVPTKVDTFRDRKLVQKAVYVAKAAGVDLGYTYGWYVHGPYSPALTRDYSRSTRLAKRSLFRNTDSAEASQGHGSRRDEIFLRSRRTLIAPLQSGRSL